MAESPTNIAEHKIAFEAFGVRILVSAGGPGELARLSALLPPGRHPCPPDAVQRSFGLVGSVAEGYDISRDGHVSGRRFPLDIALGLLDADVREYLALNAIARIFVHAGAVAHHGRTIVIPGPSLSGKTTLVAALVRAGATYYSDEFAVFDEDGRVHPYAKPLSLRSGSLMQDDHPVEGLGGVAGTEPLPVGVIVATSYRPGASWDPKRLTTGEAVLTLLANTVPVRDRPEESLQAVTRGTQGAVVLKGDRGEAEELVPLLMAELERA